MGNTTMNAIEVIYGVGAGVAYEKTDSVRKAESWDLERRQESRAGSQETRF